MYRAVKAVSFVFIALMCHAYGRRRDEIGQNNVGHKQRESKHLNPLEATAVVTRGRQILQLNGIEVGGSSCEQLKCKSHQLCISHAESGRIACVRKKLLSSRSLQNKNRIRKLFTKKGAVQGNDKLPSIQKKVDRMKKEARQFERKRRRSQQKRLAALTSSNPLVRTEQALVAVGQNVSAKATTGPDVACRRKKLEGLGRRLLDRFKVEYEQTKKKRKNHKEKRNSTKKELREDDECTCQSMASWEFQQLDTDFDGHLSDTELRPLKPSSDRVEAACVTKFTTACDHDKDGTLSEKEWCCCFADVLPPCMAALKDVPSLLIQGQPSVIPGAYVPQCDDDGFFRRLQCHGSTGQCWCVDHSGHRLTAMTTMSGSLKC